MRVGLIATIVISMLLSPVPAWSGKGVADLEFHEMQNYCWMRLAEIVPEITDRVILPIGVQMEEWSPREKLPFVARAWFNRYGEGGQGND